MVTKAWWLFQPYTMFGNVSHANWNLQYQVETAKLGVDTTRAVYAQIIADLDSRSKFTNIRTLLTN